MSSGCTHVAPRCTPAASHAARCTPHACCVATSHSSMRCASCPFGCAVGASTGRVLPSTARSIGSECPAVTSLRYELAKKCCSHRLPIPYTTAPVHPSTTTHSKTNPHARTHTHAHTRTRARMHTQRGAHYATQPPPLRRPRRRARRRALRRALRRVRACGFVPHTLTAHANAHMHSRSRTHTRGQRAHRRTCAHAVHCATRTSHTVQVRRHRRLRRRHPRRA